MNELSQMGMGAPQPQVTLDQTTAVVCSNKNCDGQLFQNGVIFRKVSKLISGTDKDGLIPVQAPYCVKCNTVLSELIPASLRDEASESGIGEASNIIT